jgi:hypothetical protein
VIVTINSIFKKLNYLAPRFQQPLETEKNLIDVLLQSGIKFLTYFAGGVPISLIISKVIAVIRFNDNARYIVYSINSETGAILCRGYNCTD